MNPYIQSFLAPDLNLNPVSLNLPVIQVRDVGERLFLYERIDSNINPTFNRIEHYTANLTFGQGEKDAPGQVKLDWGNMSFDMGAQAPKSFNRLYSDAQGNTLQIERFNQKSQPNPEHATFVQFYEKESRLARLSPRYDQKLWID